MRTIHIYGMLVKTGRKGMVANRDYQDPKTVGGRGEPTLTYHVQNDITPHMVQKMLRDNNVRIAPVDRDGNVIRGVIAFTDPDDDVYREKPLSASELQRRLRKDLEEIRWITPDE